MARLEIPAELMASLLSDKSGDDASRPVHAAQIMEISARYEDYQRTLSRDTFPFVEGQLVTPRQGSTLRQQGDPHIVLEIRPDAAPCFTADVDASDKPTYGARHNMRVMSLSGGDSYCAWSVEAFQFIPYEPPS